MNNTGIWKRLLVLSSLFFVFTLHATTPNSKVGLVLSGGGAKGIAHIGVIKALEDNDIPIDYVTGTSAGAIVGSLYACGYTPEEMLALFMSESFKYWSSGTIDPENVYFEQKPASTPAWVDFNFNLGKSGRTKNNIISEVLPANLISSIPMSLEFLKLYAPYSKQCGENFDNLFVPLRTVCSDVYHKHKIVCKDGSLGDAVRASMSFPLVFKPIEMDGVLVYDGGIYDNFPFDVMHEDFNPNFIIGVSVSGPDGKPKPNDIYSQLEDMIIQKNDYDLPAEMGVKIQVPVLSFGVFDWGSAEEIYQIGYDTGMAMVDSIKARCSARRPLETVEKRRAAFKLNTPELQFNNVTVSGGSPSQNLYIEHIFKPEEDKYIDVDQISEAYYRIVADGKVTKLLPQAQFEGESSLLTIETNIKKPWNVGVGGWVTTSMQSQLYLSVGYNSLIKRSFDVALSGWLGQSYYAGMFSSRVDLPSSLPSSLRIYGVVSRQKMYEEELMFYENGSINFVTEAQQFGALEYDLAFTKPSMGYVRVAGGHVQNRFYNENVRNTNDYVDVAATVGYKINTLDFELYPMAGRFLDVDVTGLYERGKENVGVQKYVNQYKLSAHGEWKQFFRTHNNFIVGIAAEGLITLGKPYQSYMATTIHSAAFAPTPSTRNYYNAAFRSDNFLAAGLIPIWNPFQKFQLRGDFFVFSPVRNLVETAGGCRYDGWFRRAEFIGEVAAVYSFKFASLSLYCNYLTAPARNWNFGINLGLYFPAPRLIR